MPRTRTLHAARRSNAASSTSRQPTIPGSPSCRRIASCGPGPGIAFSLDDLWARLDDAYETVPAADGRAALATAASMHATHHAFAVVAHDGAAVLRRPRRVGGSPRDRLDVAVLETEVLGPGRRVAAT